MIFRLFRLQKAIGSPRDYLLCDLLLSTRKEKQIVMRRRFEGMTMNN